MMGMETVAMPVLEGIKKDSAKYRAYESGANTAADTPASALAALVRIHTSRPVMDMSTETPRATATTSATETRSAHPCRIVSTSSFSCIPATLPMIIVIVKNQMPHSVKYHWPSGRPVKSALHAVLRSSPVAPISNKPTPNVCHGIKPIIMTTNVRAKRMRTRF